MQDRKTIVVVSGIPRSGTSLMMSILGQAGIPLLTDDARAPDDSNPRGYFELAAVRKTNEDSAWLEQAPGQAVKVIHRLLPALPDEYHYRVILMHRPVEEVVQSQDRMLARLGADPTDLPTDRVQAIFKEQHAQTRILLENGAHFEWIEIAYPTLIQAPEAEIERVIRFLELEAEVHDLATAIDDRLYRERL
ncbi:MAG: sulfotransferase family protein [Spirochaeta sp.]|nr:sulfotransferase family protein [Spirochaeta sp.]RPG11357.1 MAG: sulfotransferase family protein [Proteobacteria bacterium TMED72]